MDDALPRRPAEASIDNEKTIVITGAAGFIGSHLAEALLDRDCSVVGIDNLLTGDLANIAHLAGRDFVFIKHDVTNYINVDGPVDVVLHWASPASPIDYLELPIPTLKVGALGTHKALGLAKAKGARFVIASTSEVYGDPLEHPQKESYWGNVNPIGPRGVYDEAKRFAEAMTMAYHRYHGRRHEDRADLQHLRPAHAHQGRPRGAGLHLAGAPQRGRHGVRRRHADAQLLLRGRSRRRHPALMDSNVNDPVNIGNPHEMTIEGIARTIIEMTGSKSRIIYQDLPESTTPKSASPTSPEPARCWAGSRR